MSEYSQILYIDPEDNIERVRNHIRTSNKNKVVLVLPEENKNLKNIESLTILKKESQGIGKKITIYSTDLYYKRLAEDCGIEIEESLVGGSFLNKEGEVSFRPSVSDILPKREINQEKEKRETEETVAKEDFSWGKEKFIFEEKQEKEPEKRNELKPVISRKNQKISPFFYLFLISLIAAGVILAINFLPKADIIIVPVSEKVDFDGKFTVERGAEINLNKNILPGTIISKEKTIEKTFSTTNEEEKSEKATGVITIYNKDTSSHKFVIGTRFESSDGKIFRSQSAVSISAGSEENPATAEVNVVADKAGEEYNVPPSDFTIPGLKGTAIYDKISAKSSKAMSGGFVGTTKVISKKDIEAAKQEILGLKTKTIEELKKELLDKFSKEFSFLKDVILTEEGEITFDKKEGEIADSFRGSIKIKAKLLTFKKEDLQKIISKIIKSKIKEGVEFKEILETQKIEYSLLTKDKNVKKLEISFEGEEGVAQKIDESKIKKEIIGKNADQFKKYITEENKGKIKDAKLSLWPFYVERIPIKENRIFVEVKYK